MQTEKFRPEGKRIMPGSRYTKIFQPENERIMPETSFPALSVYPRVGIFLSASKTMIDSVCLYYEQGLKIRRKDVDVYLGLPHLHVIIYMYLSTDKAQIHTDIKFLC